MRIRRLDLTRFGKFTDYAIDFGQGNNGPDLHIVYGPNETGKSTTLAAVLDLLFGIETRSPYDFLHPYPTMRLGAALELSSGARQVFRIKRPQNSLLDADDQPIPEALLRSDFGGIDRASYRTMFSLDDETLEAGGKSIMASEGDLGQLLFSASAGLADFSRQLGELKSEADGFYKKRARTGELGDLKHQVDVLKAERANIDTLASRYAQMTSARESAVARYDEAIAARGATQARIDEIQRLLSALPRLTALRAAREKLAPLVGLPEAPAGIAEELETVQRNEIELATRSANLVEKIEELTEQIDKEEVDGIALALVDRVSRLPELRARYLTATKDIPERRLQIREADVAIAGILRRVDRTDEPDPERLVLPAATVGALRDLLERRSGIASSLKTAENEVSDARRRVDEARAGAEAAGHAVESNADGDGAAAALAATLSAFRTDDHRARLRLADKTLASHRDTLSERLRALRPWVGSPDDLLDTNVPDRFSIEGWKNDLAATRQEVDRYQRDLERLTADRSRLDAELMALKEAAGVVTDSEAESVRVARDEAWAEHRRQMDPSTADAFEIALRRDDGATSSRFMHARELAKLHQGLQSMAALDADIATTATRLEVAKASLRRIEGDIADALRRVSTALPGDMSPEQLGAWIASRELALEAFAAVRAVERDRSAAKDDGDASVERLRAALDVSGVSYAPESTFEHLSALAQASVDHAADVKQFRRDFEERQRALADRERLLEQASAEDREWNSEWAAAYSTCWLGDGDHRSVAEVREILTAVGDLGSLIEKKNGLADRVAKMERDQEDFATVVGDLATELGITQELANPLDLASAVEASVRDAETARNRRVEKEQALEAVTQKQRELAETLSIHERRKAELLGLFGAATLPEVGAMLQQVERRASLRAEADAARTDIVNAIGSKTIEEAEKSLADLDRAALETELAELKGRFDDQDQRSRELFTEHSKAVDAVSAIGDDDAVARIEERRRTVLLEIEEKAARYLKLRIGVAAAEQALRIYRDKHRSSMMARASEAFSTISRGAYTGLTTQPDKDAEMLVAVGADGRSKIASALSKGTRFQLYLALRVAGYHEFAASHPPVPFLADDIMETFDNFRAEEAFRLFAQMAEVGQVIYFTHHPHLCDIARNVCPSVTVHELPQGISRTETMANS
ncbi:MAG: AAA family ATPase [Mesorhizobium sp.]